MGEKELYFQSIFLDHVSMGVALNISDSKPLYVGRLLQLPPFEGLLIFSYHLPIFNTFFHPNVSYNSGMKLIKSLWWGNVQRFRK